MEQFLIQVSQEGELFMASVFRHGTSKDEREGSFAVMLGMAAGPDRDDAIYDAVTNAFFEGGV
jgi:hypothetical protein